jgi:hypothetical protein
MSQPFTVRVNIWADLSIEAETMAEAVEQATMAGVSVSCPVGTATVDSVAVSTESGDTGLA